MGLRWFDVDAMRMMMPINELIDRLIDECSGDVYAALKALLVVNERLEAELQWLSARLNIHSSEFTSTH